MTNDARLDQSPVKRLFCFGFGYCAQALAHELVGSDARAEIAATRTTPDEAGGKVVKLAVFDGQSRSTGVASLLAGTTHILISIPPDASGDRVLRHHVSDLLGLETLQWVGYLSTIGVYGDSNGQWIDETATIDPKTRRGAQRAVAESQWREFATRRNVTTQVFRLPGIYGPGRSAIDTLRAGTARRIVKPDQVFNRIHVTDIARALRCAMSRSTANSESPHDIYNLVDDEPAPPQDVIAFAAEILQMPVPPAIAFEQAELSPMARSFYESNKRVSNARLKRNLGFELLYPTYREGLRAIASAGKTDM